MVVTPAPGLRQDRVARVQNPSFFLDSGFRRNDGKARSATLYEFITVCETKTTDQDAH
jgi:hypothetical protein